MERYKARIEIKKKTGILDPESESISKVINNRWFDCQNLCLSKIFEFELCAESFNDAKVLINEVSDRFLSNPIIEQYEILYIESCNESEGNN